VGPPSRTFGNYQCLLIVVLIIEYWSAWFSCTRISQSGGGSTFFQFQEVTVDLLIPSETVTANLHSAIVNKINKFVMKQINNLLTNSAISTTINPKNAQPANQVVTRANFPSARSNTKVYVWLVSNCESFYGCCLSHVILCMILSRVTTMDCKDHLKTGPTYKSKYCNTII